MRVDKVISSKDYKVAYSEGTGTAYLKTDNNSKKGARLGLATFVGLTAADAFTNKEAYKDSLKFIKGKNFSSLMNRLRIRATMDGFLHGENSGKIANKVYELAQKSKAFRVAVVAGPALLVAGAFVGIGKLVGKVADYVENKKEAQKADILISKLGNQ